MRVTGVADGTSDFDAVNFRQLKGFATDAFSGIAANAVAAGAKADIAKYVSMTVGAGVSRSNVTANAGLGVSLW